MKSDYLGKQVTDPITGFSGIVTGHVVYLDYEETLYVEAPMTGDGKTPAHWIPVKRLFPSAS